MQFTVYVGSTIDRYCIYYISHCSEILIICMYTYTHTYIYVYLYNIYPLSNSTAENAVQNLEK